MNVLMREQRKGDLARRAFRGMLIFVVALWVLIFLPAGSLGYWQGWVFWTQFSAWTVGITLYFVERDPALVERRLRAGPAAEREPAQKRIQLFTSIFFCGTFLVSALDHRLGWSAVPLSASIIGNMLVAVGYLIVFFVFRENSFASAVIEVRADQEVISTGLYAWVRHPMYGGALVMFLGTPIALGSYWGGLRPSHSWARAWWQDC
jgi:protein-S-isoprenylcysteine O-methyltransferase Ste14